MREWLIGSKQKTLAESNAYPIHLFLITKMVKGGSAFLRLKVRNSLYVSLSGSKSYIITAQVFNVLFDKLNNCLLIYQFLRKTAIRVPCSLVKSCNCYCTCNNVLTNFNHRPSTGITGIQHHTQPYSFPNEKLSKRITG